MSSEEETFSDLSLLIFYNNWKGILSQVGRGGGAAALFKRDDCGTERAALVMVNGRDQPALNQPPYPLPPPPQQAMPYCADAETECAAFVAATRNATDCLGLDIQVGFLYCLLDTAGCLLDTCYLPLPASLDHGAC